MAKDLKEIVNKTVSNVINELSISQKKRNNKNAENFFRKLKGGFNGIKSIVITSAENPDSKSAPRPFNKKATSSLLDDLKSMRYVFVPSMGRFDGNDEHSYAVFNMDVNVAKKLNGKYQQTSFVVSTISNEGVVHSDYWEKKDKMLPYNERENDYVIKDECDEWIDLAKAKDNFTIIGKTFKFSIPFSIFENVNGLFCNNIKRIIEIEKERGDKLINEDKIIEFTMRSGGQSPYLWRRALTRGFFND